MTTYVADYSFSRPDLGALKASGFVGVVRYLAPRPNGKVIDNAERQRIAAAGLALSLVWETTANRSGAGYDAGVTDAQRANNQADQLGYTGAIYYATDFDAAPGAVEPYYRGVAGAGGRPAGIYAGFGPVDALARVVVPYGWQTGAWSGGRLSRKAHLYQRINKTIPSPGDVDENVVCDPAGDWGQEGAPKPQPLIEEEPDMVLIWDKGGLCLFAGGRRSPWGLPPIACDALIAAGVKVGGHPTDDQGELFKQVPPFDPGPAAGVSPPPAYTAEETARLVAASQPLVLTGGQP